MDDYTLFSRRRLVPYGQSYAPNTSGRFEQGNMRIKQMQRAQAVRRAAEIAAEARPLAIQYNPRLPNPDANADMPSAYDAPAPTTLRSAPVPNMADDYTLFSPRRLVPYGQSYAPNRSAYAPNRSGRFFKGMMTNPIKFTPQGSQSTRQEQERMLMQARRLQERLERSAPVPKMGNVQAALIPPLKPDVREISTDLPLRLGGGPADPVTPLFMSRNIWRDPARPTFASSPKLPLFGYMANRYVEPSDNGPQSAGERAIAIAKGLPQQVYRAVTKPVETAKAVANAVLSGEDYQSSGEPVVQNGVINWGDPDNSADFFRADQALQELHPYVEPETPPEPANEGYSNGGIVSELLNEVADFVNPGFAGGGEVGGEYDYVEPEMVYDDEYDYVEPETVYDDEYDYVEPEMAEDLDGFAHGGPVEEYT